jgi:hypothetical protein
LSKHELSEVTMSSLFDKLKLLLAAGAREQRATEPVPQEPQEEPEVSEAPLDAEELPEVTEAPVRRQTPIASQPPAEPTPAETAAAPETADGQETLESGRVVDLLSDRSDDHTS